MAIFYYVPRESVPPAAMGYVGMTTYQTLFNAHYQFIQEVEGIDSNDVILANHLAEMRNLNSDLELLISPYRQDT